MTSRKKFDHYLRRVPQRCFKRLALVAFLSTILNSSAQAAVIDVLWYSYALDTSPYKSEISSLANGAHTWLESSGHLWDLTFYGPNDITAPNFADYDVLVIHSAEAFWTSNTTNPRDTIEPDFRGILDNKSNIESARGERTVISATDGDFHAARGDTGHTAQFVSDYDEWDGAIGYTINNINWAAEGDGLGIVSFYHGEQGSNAYWWTDDNSFLKDELDGYVADFRKDLGFGQRDNFPLISPGAEDHPLNVGLSADGLVGTPDGLENWQWSFHGGFAKDIPGYTGVQESSKHPDYFVTVATTLVPIPAAMPLMLSTLVLLRFAVGRRSR